MQNLITGSSANSVLLDEVKTNTSPKFSSLEAGEDFNKIFEKTTNNNKPKEPIAREDAKKPVQNKEVSTSEKKEAEPVEIKEKTTTETTDETTLDVQEVDEISQKLNNIIEMLNSGELVLSEDLKQQIAEIAKQLEEFKTSGVEISSDLLKEINDLADKLKGTNFLTTTNAETTKDTLDKIISDIKNIVEPKLLKTATKETQKGEILVDERNIETQDSIEVEKKEPTVKKIIEQKILDELNLNVDKVVMANSTAETNTTTTTKTTTNASEQLIKLSIEKVSPGFETNPQSQSGSENSMNQGWQMGQNQTPQVQKPENAAMPKFVEVNKNDILNQIGAKFEQFGEGGNSKVTLMLRPNELGRVVIELNHNGNGVSTSIIAQNQSVKEMLEKNIEGLKQQLAAAGVNVQNINVKSADSAPQGGFDEEPRQGSNQGNTSQDFTSSNGDKKEQEQHFENETLVEHEGEVDYKV